MLVSVDVVQGGTKATLLDLLILLVKGGVCVYI